MNSQRFCTSCNAVHDLQEPVNLCRRCKGFLSIIHCTHCKVWKPLSDYMLVTKITVNGKGKKIFKPCKECEKVRKARYYTKEASAMRMRRNYARKRELAKSLMAVYNNNPLLTFKPLTEKEWLDVCTFFGGCALCGEEHIEVRQFVQQFAYGGRYAPWNIIPLCGICSRIERRGANPFQYLDKYLGRDSSKTKLTAERRKKIMRYIMRRMEEALEQARAAKNQTT